MTTRRVDNCPPRLPTSPPIMKVKILKGVGIDGQFPEIGSTFEVTNQLGRSLIHRGVACKVEERAAQPEGPVKVTGKSATK